MPYHTHVDSLTVLHNQLQGLAAYERMSRAEFEVLHAEGARRRPTMSVPLRGFLAGRPGIPLGVEASIAWAKGFPGVWFARREEIAAIAHADPATPRAAI